MCSGRGGSTLADLASSRECSDACELVVPRLDLISNPRLLKASEGSSESASGGVFERVDGNELHEETRSLGREARLRKLWAVRMERTSGSSFDWT